MILGIYGLSSQSGRAFFADYLNKGYDVIGYARPTVHGLKIINAIKELNGIYLERPENSNHENSKFVPLGNGIVTDNLKDLVDRSDIIIIALPSIFHENAAKDLLDFGILRRSIPIVLSPSRSFASPYLWKILGNNYPIICFSTCPYSCKAPKPAVSLIKRRKRTYIASLEGNINRGHINILRELFPQAALTIMPALTTLNNIGAILHCATYMMNIEVINQREATGEIFSFYMDGIVSRPDVGQVLEQIDQVRLEIANSIGIKTFGLKSNPRENIWRKLTNGLRALEEESADDIEILRRIRKEFTEYLDYSVLSVQHWLDITYGVLRKENESICNAIKRTPTYQNNSVPQIRYVTEDIPTGLVVIEALANILNIKCDCCTKIIDLYNTYFNTDARKLGRNLTDFSNEYIVSYLKGEYTL